MANGAMRSGHRVKALPAPVRGALLGGICLASMWLGAVAGRPFVLARSMRAENDGIERHTAELRYETQQLTKQATALSTDAGMEREARRLGYLKPGEIPLLIPPK